MQYLLTFTRLCLFSCAAVLFRKIEKYWIRLADTHTEALRLQLELKRNLIEINHTDIHLLFLWSSCVSETEEHHCSRSHSRYQPRPTGGCSPQQGVSGHWEHLQWLLLLPPEPSGHRAGQRGGSEICWQVGENIKAIQPILSKAFNWFELISRGRGRNLIFTD